jgi:large subunit ribosomal protein LP2
MRVLAAYLLLALGGNKAITSKDLKKVIEAAGASFDQARADLLVKELEGKDLQEVIAAGKEKMATVSVGVAAGGGGGGGAAAAGGAAPAAKEEEKEESDDDMGLDLFD